LALLQPDFSATARLLFDYEGCFLFKKKKKLVRSIDDDEDDEQRGKLTEWA